MFALCLKYSRSYVEAQDNLQEGFLLLFEKIEKYDGKGAFYAWAKRVVINYILQQYRNKDVFNVMNEELPELPAIKVEIEENIPLDYLMKKIQKLPNKYRLVFNLQVLDGYSHKEIATMLEISEGTSKSNLARAKQMLKKEIEKETPLLKI